MEATSPTNTGVNMRRGIVALGAFAAVTALAACSGNTTPAATDNDTTATLTIWADDTRFTQVQTFASDFTAETGVAVNVVQKSEADMDTEFTTQVPTGNGPDLIVMAHDKLGALVANGVVAPVDLGEAKSQFSDVAVKAVTYNGQTYGVPYAVESVALVRNDALTSDTPTTYDDLISSGKASGAEYPFIIQMGDKGDPYHFYAFQTSFGAPVFKTNSEGEYTAELAMNGSGGTEFANWLKAQGDAGIVSPSITGDIAKQKFLDGAAAYTVTGPWNVAAFRAAGMKVSVLPVPAAGSQAAQPFVGSTRAPSPPTRLPPSSSSTTWLPPRPRKRCRSSVAAPPRCPRLPLLPMTRTSRTSPRLLRAARSLPRSLRWVPSGTSGARPRPIS